MSQERDQLDAMFGGIAEPPTTDDVINRIDLLEQNLASDRKRIAGLVLFLIALVLVAIYKIYR